jgi:intracellular septation protein
MEILAQASHVTAMKQFFDLLPVLLFVVVFFIVTDRDIFISTAVLMVAEFVQVAVTYLIHRSVDKQTQVVFWVVMLFGGATLYFRDQVFIQWKPTVVNWFFAAALLGSHFIGERNLLQKMLDSQIDLPRRAWRNLSLGWVLGFLFAGALNLVVAYYFSLEFWVTYKLVGGLCLTACYIVATIVYLVLGGYLKETKPTEPNPVSPTTEG